MTRRTWIYRAGSVCVWALVAILVPPVPAWAHFSTSAYTFKSGSGCGTAVDPINFGFYGPGAYWSGAATHVSHHSRWDNIVGSSQASRSHSNCYTMGTQRASHNGGLGSEGNHIRFFWAHDDGQGIQYSVGDAHYDAWVWCGHAVPATGFDNARNRLKTIMSDGGHYTTTNYWGNTRTFKQCHGKYAGSNGYVAWAWI